MVLEVLANIWVIDDDVESWDARISGFTIPDNSRIFEELNVPAAKMHSFWHKKLVYYRSLSQERRLRRPYQL